LRYVFRLASVVFADNKGCGSCPMNKRLPAHPCCSRRQRSRGKRVAQRKRCPEGAEARARAQTELDHVAAQARATSTASHAAGLVGAPTRDQLRHHHLRERDAPECALGLA
jgi:hypothetical protein